MQGTLWLTKLLISLGNSVRNKFLKCFCVVFFFLGPLFTPLLLYEFLPVSLLRVLQLFSANHLSSQSFMVLIPPLLVSSKSGALSGSLSALYFITAATLSAATIIKKAAALSLERE